MPNEGGIAEWQSKVSWAALGLVVATVYDVGAQLKSDRTWTWRGFVGDLCLRGVNGFVAVKLASLADLSAPDTAYLALGLCMLGQKTAQHIFRSLVLKWLGVPVEPVREPSRAAPIEQLGARLGAEEWPRAIPTDPDQDLLDKLGGHP